jgi:hypothetical protein
MSRSDLLDEQPVVDRIADLTPAWLSAALARGVAHRPGLDGVEATAVGAEAVGTGQMGTTYRLTVTYAPGTPAGPALLVAKLPVDDPERRAVIADSFRKEVGFYTELAPTVDVETPGCWYGALSPDGTGFTLLLDDLAPARPGVQADGCSLDQARAAVRNLAGLHAPRWNDPTLGAYDYLPPIDEAGAAFLGQLHVTATETYLERYRDDLSRREAELLTAAAARTGSWLTARPEPSALTHGDYRLDNLMFHPDGRVSALDWQTPTVAPPLRDLAYFLGTSLTVEDRRAHEWDLVALYHEALVERGVHGYDAGRCFGDYRFGMLQGPLITVIGSEFATAERTAGADGMFLAMTHRSCAALDDLDVFDLL